MPTISFTPEIYEFHFFQSLQWVEQKSSKTKMAVAEAAKVQLNVCFVQLDFYLKPHPRPEAQSRICELILGSVWKVSYQHLMASQGFLCSEAAIVILNWWCYISTPPIHFTQSTNLINSSQKQPWCIQPLMPRQPDVFVYSRILNPAENYKMGLYIACFS